MKISQSRFNAGLVNVVDAYLVIFDGEKNKAVWVLLKKRFVCLSCFDSWCHFRGFDSFHDLNNGLLRVCYVSNCGTR